MRDKTKIWAVVIVVGILIIALIFLFVGPTKESSDEKVVPLTPAGEKANEEPASGATAVESNTTEEIGIVEGIKNVSE